MRTEKFIMVCFIISLVLMTVGTATASTITVNNSTGTVANFTSIQAAVDAALDGDIILVYPGTYSENVDVNKQLNITSTGGYAVTHVTAASPSDNVFEVTADWVTIDGFNVSGATDRKAGIHLEYHSSDNTLNNNHVWNNQFGIHLDYLSNDNTLNNNHVSNNLYGIYLDGSSNATLNNNHASNNTYQGIDAVHSNYNTLTNNTVSNNSYGINLVFSRYNTLTSNKVSDNNVTGIRLEFSYNNTLTINTASNNTEYGIILYDFSNNNSLTSNTVSNNTAGGIILSSSSNNLIYNNHFNNFDNTVFSLFSTDNVWNSTKTAGTNIIGGSYLGGNYWAKPDGTGFSQINVDMDCDGFCDSPLSKYELDVTNIDYLALCLVAYNPYDKNEDYVIDFGEVSAAIDDYILGGPISFADISGLIDMYRSGEPYC